MVYEFTYIVQFDKHFESISTIGKPDRYYPMGTALYGSAILNHTNTMFFKQLRQNVCCQGR